MLKPVPGYAERIPERNEMIRQGLSGEGSAPPGVLRVDERLKPKTMILGLAVGGSDEAFPLTLLRQERVINLQLGGDPVLVVHQPASDTTTAFIARAKGMSLKFGAANAETSDLVDEQTKSHWNAYGECMSGSLKGSKLTSLILEPEYWFACRSSTLEPVSTNPNPKTSRQQSSGESSLFDWPCLRWAWCGQRNAFFGKNHRQQFGRLGCASVI